MPNPNNQTDEWQIQVSKRKKNNQRKQKKGQRYSSKDQLVNKNKRDNSYYYQTSKKNKDQNGNKNKNGKRSNKFENKLKKQNKGRDNILDIIPIERNKNLNIIKSTSLLKIQFERQQNSQKDGLIDLKSKGLLLNPKKTISEMSDVTAVSVTSLASESNTETSSTLTQTNSLKDQIENGNEVHKSSISKEKLSDATLLNKESECSSSEKDKMESSQKIASPLSSSTSSIAVKTVNTTGIIDQKKDEIKEDNREKDELIRKLESACSLSSSSSTSFDSNSSTKSDNHSGDDNESVITAKNDADELKMNENKKETESKKSNEEDTNTQEKVSEKKKDDMTKKVLEFNFKDYTDVQPFIPKHLKAQQEKQQKVEIIAPKPQNSKFNNHIKSVIEKKHFENESTPKRKTKEINKIIRIDPSCLHQRDGHIVPISSVINNMKNGKNYSGNNAQETLQRNIQLKTNELQEIKKKKYEELRKLLDNNDKSSNNTQGYQSLPIRENIDKNNNSNTNNTNTKSNSNSTNHPTIKKIEDKVIEKPQVRKTMSNSTLEVSSNLKNKKEHQRTSSYTMNHMMHKSIPNLGEYKDDYLCHSISQLDLSNRIENEYNNVKCYNDPMEQSLTRVKPASIKSSNSIQNITTTLSRKGSNHQLLLGSGGCMTITNTITTCKNTPRLRTSKSFSWLRGVRTGLDNTHVTTLNTTTSTSHTSTLYTNILGSSTYYPLVVLPTSSVQELSVETNSRKLKSSTSLPDIMGKLIRKFTWPFSGKNIESKTPFSIKK